MVGVGGREDVTGKETVTQRMGRVHETTEEERERSSRKTTRTKDASY